MASTGIETGGTRGGKIAKRLTAAVILLAVAAIAPTRADAHHGGYGHGWHGRPWHGGHHGRWYGGWGYPAYPYGAPAFYFPPPVVYAPPPPVYAPPPPPVVYLPPPPSLNFVFSWSHH